MLSLIANYYYISIVLQAVCAIHCIRKGNQQKWIWIIIFLPLAGCLIYLFSEVFTKRDIQQVQSNVGAVFNPSGKIKTLQENLRFADTFNNRIVLGDAYLDAGQFNKAIDLYEQSLYGNFTDNEHANMQLINAYYHMQRYGDIINIAKKICHLAQFKLSRAHMYYAISLGYTGNNEMAEREFNLMKGRFSNYECRYHFGQYLLRTERYEDSYKIFRDMLSETTHLTSKEKRENRSWFDKSKEAMKTIETA
ncbi:tetratricopeptide repeat protein [soil metagenome]